MLSTCWSGAGKHCTRATFNRCVTCLSHFTIMSDFINHWWFLFAHGNVFKYYRHTLQPSLVLQLYPDIMDVLQTYSTTVTCVTVVPRYHGCVTDILYNHHLCYSCAQISWLCYRHTLQPLLVLQLYPDIMDVLQTYSTTITCVTVVPIYHGCVTDILYNRYLCYSCTQISWMCYRHTLQLLLVLQLYPDIMDVLQTYSTTVTCVTVVPRYHGCVTDIIYNHHLCYSCTQISWMCYRHTLQPSLVLHIRSAVRAGLSIKSTNILSIGKCFSFHVAPVHPAV